MKLSFIRNRCVDATSAYTSIDLLKVLRQNTYLDYKTDA